MPFMASEIKRKTQPAVGATAGAVALLLLVGSGVWSAWPRQLSAETIGDAKILIQRDREEQILFPMCQQFEAVSMKGEEEKEPSQEIADGWQKLETSLQKAGAAADSARQITARARENWSGEWPCFVERGTLHGTPVFYVVGSQANLGLQATVCPMGSSEIHRDRVDRYCRNLRVVAVSMTAPFEVVP